MELWHNPGCSKSCGAKRILDDLGALQQVVERANQWVRTEKAADDKWQPEPLLAELPLDLRNPLGPMQPVLDRLDPSLRNPVVLSEQEFGWLVDFVRNGLLDPAAQPQKLRRLIPGKLPGGRPNLIFQF